MTRSPQITTLEFDSADVLGSWSASNDSFVFVGNSTLGEQVALTGMQRWTGPFPGSLLYGDFALRYTGSKLVLTSNIDFLGAAFAEIGSPAITVTSNTLMIQGDMLIGGGLFALDQTAVPGTNLGHFTLTASTEPVNPGGAVPEPASLGLWAIGGLSLLLGRRRSK